LEENELKDLLNDVKQMLSDDLCYPADLREVIKGYSIGDVSFNLLKEVQKHFDKLSRKGDAEKFLKNYYTSVVLYSDVFFQGIGKPYSTLFAKKLGDKLIGYYKKPMASPAPKPLEISQRELGSLQYISGYVITKLLKKTRNHKNYKTEECQAIITMLENMKTSEESYQRLIQTLDRGGLTTLKPAALSIFKIIEERYRIETRGNAENAITKIDTKKITAFLLKNLDIKSLFNSFSGDLSLPLNAELKDNLLEKLISLYLRVRAFSTARDMIEKHRDLQKKT